MYRYTGLDWGESTGKYIYWIIQDTCIRSNLNIDTRKSEKSMEDVRIKSKRKENYKKFAEQGVTFTVI